MMYCFLVKDNKDTGQHGGTPVADGCEKPQVLFKGIKCSTLLFLHAQNA